MAPHGAGLVNLVFCKRKARVVEVFPRDLLAPSPFWTLASLAQLRYAMLLATRAEHAEARSWRAGKALKDSDLVVDVEALASLVDPWIATGT